MSKKISKVKKELDFYVSKMVNRSEIGTKNMQLILLNKLAMNLFTIKSKKLSCLAAIFFHSKNVFLFF